MSLATRLDPKLRDRLLDALLDVPGTDERSGRTALLSNIPGPVKGSLNRADNQLVDLANVVDQLDKLGRLDNGDRPIVIMTHNAWRATRGTELGQLLAEIENEIEGAYGGDEPLAELTDEPEILVFGGTGEWVTGAFIAQAQLIGRRVARLVVPRYSSGKLVSQAAGTGTGWLVAPRLLLTNHHVINARDVGEPPASDVDFRRQGEKAKAWFDYHREGQDGAASVDFSEVITSHRELDYALLRLADSAELADREQVSLMRERPDLPPGARLNIVQCPGGGPLRYAIRNNFFVGYGDKSYQIRYLTDTVRGSSGAPVLDDNWQAVGLHRGFKKVNPDLYKGEAGKSEIVKFHNEGIVIHDILAQLPHTVLEEIKHAQGWD
jgi:V8-like Glu-specific endopeptidase